jgi:hypothetical protein
MLVLDRGGVLEQKRLLALQPLRELVHRLLVAALIEAREGADGVFDFLCSDNVHGHLADLPRPWRRVKAIWT